MPSTMEEISSEWCVNDVLQKHDKVDAMLEKVLELDQEVQVIEESQLESLGIRRLAPLDVDQETIDLEPIFFRPLPPDLSSWSELRSAVQGQQRYGRRDDCICPWQDVCRGEGTEDHFLCAGPAHEARSRLRWFCDALIHAGSGPDAVGFLEKNPDWRLFFDKPCDWKQHRLPDHSGDPWGPPGGEDSEEENATLRFQYDMSHCFLPTEEHDEVSVWAPRSAGAVIQSHKARGDTLLRSELHSALHLLIHVLEHGMEDYHHTTPVLIYSFHQDKTARVTQFHFNGEHLLFRQSRLLDLAADKPTEDAYLLLRWMISLPVGETTFTALNELVETQTINTDDGAENQALPVSPREENIREGLSVGA